MEDIVLHKTYELKPGPPPMSWSEYSEISREEWANILDGSQPPSEKTVSEFLSRNPSFVPGARSLNLPSGHAPVHGALFVEPSLSGTFLRRPDFMWISNDSLTVDVVLIEIEEPGKRMFNGRGEISSKFTQGFNQLKQWESWFSKPSNQQVFSDTWLPTRYQNRVLRQSYVYIFGRRAEYENDDYRRNLRATWASQGIELISFDRLAPDQNCQDYITVRGRVYNNRALHVPPTLRLGPFTSRLHKDVSGVADAAKKCSYMTPQRRAFVLERLEYWTAWAKQEQVGLIGYGDFE